MESISKQVLEANESHKNALDQYTSKLQAELNAVNKLIAAVEDLSDENLHEDPGDKWCLHSDGAFKPSGIIELTEALDEKSPFLLEAVRRERYTRSLAPSPFSASEKRYLEKAVMKENKRLAAIRAQQSGQHAFEAVTLDNEYFLQNTEGINWASVARDVSASNNPLGSRMAQECKVRWLGAQHPKFDSGTWSEADDKRLHDLVESQREFGHLDWEEIAKLLDTNRTALDCIKRFQASTRPPFRWTNPLDKKLLQAVEMYGSANWVLVASSISPKVSANQCQIRYERTLNPDIKRGKFTAEEDELLMKAIEVHGSDWVKVAQAVPGRTNAQCRGRYTLHLTGGIIKTPWDPEEDTRLRAAVDKYGHKWEKVREEMGSNRHQTQYATRFRILTRWDAQDATEGATSSPAPQPRGGTNSETIIATSKGGAAKGTKAASSTKGPAAEAHHTTTTSPIVNAEEAPDPDQAAKINDNLEPHTAAKGISSKRGRKRKAPEPDVTGDPSASTPRKRSRPKPKPTGAMAAASQPDPDNTVDAEATSQDVEDSRVDKLSHVNDPAPAEKSIRKETSMIEPTASTDNDMIPKPNARRTMTTRSSTRNMRQASTKNG